MKRYLRKTVRFILVSGGVLLCLLAVFVAGRHLQERHRENAAKREWSKLLATARAEGRELEASPQQRHFPPSQNLLALPLFIEWQKSPETWDAALKQLELVGSKTKRRKFGWNDGVPFSTEAFNTQYDISLLEKLASLAPTLNAIREALDTRPYLASSVPPAPLWGKVDSFALRLLLRTNKLFKYRALLALEQGDASAAFNDLMSALRLLEIEGEKNAVALLARLSSFLSLQEVIATGLASHQWSREEIAQLQKKLEELRPLAELEAYLEGEKQFIFANLEQPTACQPASLIASMLLPVQQLLLPTSGPVQNKLALQQFTDQHLPQCLDAERGTINLEAIDAFMDANEKTPFPLSQYVELYPSIIKRAVLKQSLRNKALIACALELYWQEHQRYPDTLLEMQTAGLPPLPPDPVTREPYHYRPTATGKYLLYSRGWQESSVSGNQNWLWILPGLTLNEIADAKETAFEGGEKRL